MTKQERKKKDNPEDRLPPEQKAPNCGRKACTLIIEMTDAPDLNKLYRVTGTIPVEINGNTVMQPTGTPVMRPNGQFMWNDDVKRRMIEKIETDYAAGKTVRIVAPEATCPNGCNCKSSAPIPEDPKKFGEDFLVSVDFEIELNPAHPTPSVERIFGTVTRRSLDVKGRCQA